MKHKIIYIDESTEMTDEQWNYLLSRHDDQVDTYSFALEALFKKLSWWQRLLNWFKRRFKWTIH